MTIDTNVAAMWLSKVLLTCVIRSGLLTQAEKQLSDMHKEKATWLKAQKVQQAQVTLAAYSKTVLHLLGSMHRSTLWDSNSCSLCASIRQLLCGRQMLQLLHVAALRVLS